MGERYQKYHCGRQQDQHQIPEAEKFHQHFPVLLIHIPLKQNADAQHCQKCIGIACHTCKLQHRFRETQLQRRQHDHDQISICDRRTEDLFQQKLRGKSAAVSLPALRQGIIHAIQKNCDRNIKQAERRKSVGGDQACQKRDRKIANIKTVKTKQILQFSVGVTLSGSCHSHRQQDGTRHKSDQKTPKKGGLQLQIFQSIDCRRGHRYVQDHRFQEFCILHLKDPCLFESVPQKQKDQIYHCLCKYVTHNS